VLTNSIKPHDRGDWALGTANCPTLTVNFRNTDPNPQGLDRGRTYTAVAY